VKAVNLPLKSYEPSANSAKERITAMKEVTVLETPVSSPTTVCWENLEEFARRHIQAFLQGLLEEEVTALVGREKSARRAVPPEEELPAATPVYRNGYGKPRRLSTPSGTLTVRRPRVRGLDARFESRILPLFQRRTAAVGQLLPELYLHGLSSGDFDLALRGLLGEGAPLSASSIARLKEFPPYGGRGGSRNMRRGTSARSPTSRWFTFGWMGSTSKRGWRRRRRRSWW
jgi:hypothetical protein